MIDVIFMLCYTVMYRYIILLCYIIVALFVRYNKVTATKYEYNTLYNR